MPITIARPSVQAAITNLRDRRLHRGVRQDRNRRLRIQLVNNMPDAAVFATQRQFIRLLDDGAQAFDVTLGLMTLGSVDRSVEARTEMAGLYRDAAHLARSPTDAIIVTGAEPRAAELVDEPYWSELTRLFDTARAHSFATLASCLAAHALVLHRDNVRRRREPRKWSGLFAVDVVAKHPLIEGVGPGAMPHSRWNGIDEDELNSKGYVILTRSPEAGVDMFAKDDDHLSLFFQGHPEYDSDTLAREFRRDVARALEGASMPAPPANYYGPDAELRLRAHVARMAAGVEARGMPRFAMSGPDATWRERGARVVGNWLTAIAARKLAASGATQLQTRWGG
jgi:homoserine O-succinyltransferase/O-acetyltransferase